MSNYLELKQKMAEVRQQMLEAAKSFFTESSNDLFSENVELQNFSWKQFTPYFNDGEPCVFSAHTEEPFINDEDGYDLPENLKPLQDKVAEFLNVFNNDDMELMFGDNAQITVSRDGVEITDYTDHY